MCSEKIENVQRQNGVRAVIKKQIIHRIDHKRTSLLVPVSPHLLCPPNRSISSHRYLSLSFFCPSTVPRIPLPLTPTVHCLLPHPCSLHSTPSQFLTFLPFIIPLPLSINNILISSAEIIHSYKSCNYRTTNRNWHSQKITPLPIKSQCTRHNKQVKSSVMNSTSPNFDTVN